MLRGISPTTSHNVFFHPQNCISLLPRPKTSIFRTHSKFQSFCYTGVGKFHQNLHLLLCQLMNLLYTGQTNVSSWLYVPSICAKFSINIKWTTVTLQRQCRGWNRRRRQCRIPKTSSKLYDSVGQSIMPLMQFRFGVLFKDQLSSKIKTDSISIRNYEIVNSSDL